MMHGNSNIKGLPKVIAKFSIKIKDRISLICRQMTELGYAYVKFKIKFLNWFAYEV
jgi:hypothetical protein